MNSEKNNVGSLCVPVRVFAFACALFFFSFVAVFVMLHHDGKEIKGLRNTLGNMRLRVQDAAEKTREVGADRQVEYSVSEEEWVRPLGTYGKSECLIVTKFVVESADGVLLKQDVGYGSGFIVGKGLVATSRHVAQPWHGSSVYKDQLDVIGVQPRVVSMLGFFPGVTRPVNLYGSIVSDKADAAVVRYDAAKVKASAIPLSSEFPRAGESVAIMGYPLVVTPMIFKFPDSIYERLMAHAYDPKIFQELADHSLIRPTVTFGHIGDVVGDKIIFDAANQHGASGSPVLNIRGEALAINTAVADGFSGSNLGISVEALRPLMEKAAKETIIVEPIE